MASTQSSTKPKILIIGGGVGGLTLAQGLLQHDIPFRIFERDTSFSYRAQGYRIRISGDGVYALQKCLPHGLWEKLEASAAGGLVGLTKIDALTGEDVKLGPPGGPGGPGGPSVPGGPKSPMPLSATGRVGLNGNGEFKAMKVNENPIAVDRTVMRQVLLTGLEGHIEFGKTFQRYEMTDTGITAYFTDGSNYGGDFLVGADGTSSLVRKQYLPQLKVVDTNGRCIYGKTYITPELTAAFTSKAQSNMTIIQEQRADCPLTLFLEPTRFANPRVVPIINPDTGKEEFVKDYVYWAILTKAHDSKNMASPFHHLSPTESADLSIKVTRKWHESVTPLLTQQSKTSASTLRILSLHRDIPNWKPSTRITVLGDAAHPLPPTGGLGAVSALRDVDLLLEAILKGISEESIGEYEEEMRRWAREAIEANKLGAAKFFGGWGWDEVEGL